MGDKIFRGGSNGSWTDPLNWVSEPPFVTPGPPAPGDSVYIESDVILTADLTLTNLTVRLLDDAQIKGPDHDVRLVSTTLTSTSDSNICGLTVRRLYVDAASQLNQFSFGSGMLDLQAEIHNNGVIGSTTSTCDVMIEAVDVINAGLIVAGNGNTISVRGSNISGAGVIEIQPRSTLTFDYGGGSIHASQVLRFANPVVAPIHFMKSFTQLRFGGTLMINPIDVTIAAPILNFRPGDSVVITECDENVAWTVTTPDKNGQVTLHLTARNDDFVAIDISLTLEAPLGIAIAPDTNFSGRYVVTPRFFTGG